MPINVLNCSEQFSVVNKPVAQKTFFQLRAQRLIANLLFPAGNGCWYKKKGYGNGSAETSSHKAFTAFIAKQREVGARYQTCFEGLSFSYALTDSYLANQDKCQLEHLTVSSQVPDENIAGRGKHIIYFPGADTYYQACFRDISAAAKETGATVHAFNFPGTGASTGQVTEANDLVNAGIAMVNDLLDKGIPMQDIILQGDCYGAGVANEVAVQFQKQTHHRPRIVLNNAFRSFAAAVGDMLTGIKWFPARLKPYVVSLLKWVGWDLRPEDSYMGISPEGCHITHIGDRTLTTSTLSEAIAERQGGSMISQMTEDNFVGHAVHLANKHQVIIRPAMVERLAKFGIDQFGRPNAHFADLCEMQMGSGESVYVGFVNDFISRSDSYYANHPKKERVSNAKFLGQNHQCRTLKNDEGECFVSLMEHLSHLKAVEPQQARKDALSTSCH